jgi:FkbM family methyltransferase
VYKTRPFWALYRLLRLTAMEVMGEVSFRTPDGTPYVSPARNFSSLVVYLQNHRDGKIAAFMRRRLKPGAVFVDVGANIGVYTVPASRLVGHGGSVIAIEAHPKICGYLQRNVAMNRLHNVSVVNVAVGDRPGTLTMQYDEANPGKTRVSSDGIRVTLTTIDALLEARGIEQIDYLKVDVEGYEYKALKGAVATIKRSPGIVVQVEHIARLAQHYGDSIDDVADLLRALGLRPHVATSGGAKAVEGRLPEHVDVLWTREGLQK